MRAQPCSRSRRSSRLSARTTAYPNPALSIPSNSADPASFPSLEDITIQSRFLASCPHSMLSDEEVGASRLLQLDFSTWIQLSTPPQPATLWLLRQPWTSHSSWACSCSKTTGAINQHMMHSACSLLIDLNSKADSTLCTGSCLTHRPSPPSQGRSSRKTSQAIFPLLLLTPLHCRPSWSQRALSV